jgi:phage tail sheath gpL-like
MSITFNQIPNNFRVRGVFLEVVANGLQLTDGLGSATLLIGQKLSTGTATANQLQLITSGVQASALFGRGSMLQRMVNTYRNNDPFTTLYVLPLDDNPAGTAGTGTIVLSGTPTQAGTLNFYVGGMLVQISVATTDTAAALATRLASAITANEDLPVSATAATATVTLTAKHKGIEASDIPLYLNYYGQASGEYTPAGLTVTVNPISAGTGNPDLTSPLSTVPDEVYNYVVCPYTDTNNLTQLENELNDRWSPLKMLEGFLLNAKRGSVSQLQTYGLSRNSQYVSTLGLNTTPNPMYQVAAAYGGQVAYNAEIDPARPIAELPLVDIIGPPRQDRFQMAEINTLLYAGISPYNVGQDGKVYINQSCTTYQKTPQNVPDSSWYKSNTPLTLSRVRQIFRVNHANYWRRYKLADDSYIVPAGQFVARPKDIAARNVVIYEFLAGLGLLEDVEYFKKNQIVERNPSDPCRVDMQLPVNLINQLDVIAGQLYFRP